MRNIANRLLLAILFCLLAPAALAQNVTVEVDQAECIQIGENGLVHTTVKNQPPGSTVRVYFRRLHEEVEDPYYVFAIPEGPERHWAVLPKAEDELLEQREIDETLDDDQNEEDSDDWADWWKAKEDSDHRDPNDDLNDDVIRERAQVGKRAERDWMKDMDDEALQEWLESLENEPAEYYATVNDPTGREIARSDMKVVEVREECDLELTDRQASIAENLTVGETAPWEEGERIFHWLCDGIVTRIDPNDIYRADDICRVCFVAWWQKKELLIPALTIPPTGLILSRDDDPVSVFQP